MAFSFGQPAQQQQAAKPTFSFGALAASTTQPAANTSTSTPSFSFGNTSTTTQNNNNQQQQPTLSFGQPQQPAAAAPAATGGLSFGNSTANQNNNNSTTNTTGGFSFGGLGAKPAGQASTTTAAPAPSFSFGNTSTNQQQQQAAKPTFGFGASTSAAATNAFGLSTNQQQQQQLPPQQQNQLGASASTSTGPITKSTRFEDLPENERRQIEAIEQHIQGRIAIYDTLKNQDLGTSITETRVLLRDLIGEFAALQNHLAHDRRATTVLKTRFERSIKDGASAAQIVNNFRAPPVSQPGAPSQQSPKSNPAFLQEFFRRKAEELATRLETYKSSIEQIQSSLSRSDPDQVKAILPTLKAQHAATLQLAGKLSSLEGSVTELRDEYRDLWRERTGSVRDPFIERRRQVLGVEDGVLDSVGGLSIR